jgi:hypothetical protein
MHEFVIFSPCTIKYAWLCDFLKFLLKKLECYLIRVLGRTVLSKDEVWKNYSSTENVRGFFSGWTMSLYFWSALLGFVLRRCTAANQLVANGFTVSNSCSRHSCEKMQLFREFYMYFLKYGNPYMHCNYIGSILTPVSTSHVWSTYIMQLISSDIIYIINSVYLLKANSIGLETKARVVSPILISVPCLGISLRHLKQITSALYVHVQ